VGETFDKLILEAGKRLGFTFASMLVFAAVSMLLYSIYANRDIKLRYRTARDYAFPKQLYSNPGAKMDFKFFMMRMFLFLPLIEVAVTLFAAIGLAQFAISKFGPPAHFITDERTALLVQFSANILSAGFALYWSHRLSHTNSLLWTFHRLHHSAEEMTFLTSSRTHPMDDLYTTIALLLISPVNALALYWTGGAPHAWLPTLLLIYRFFGAIQDKFNHSHVPASFGPLNRIFLSGHMHQIHHSAEPRHRDRNFGGTLAVFDWLFGTIYIPARDEHPILGLNEAEFGDANPHKTVMDGLAEPFVYFRNQLVRVSGR
jgi:sterol desaturase/sphingolipid hydroxylase (fatty acid hydroxylase superfamily)